MSTHGRLLKILMPPQYSLFWNRERLPICVCEDGSSSFYLYCVQLAFNKTVNWCMYP